MSAQSSPKQYPFAKRWAKELEEDGHVQISTFFLENYHRLKPYPLTHGEAMFVVHLMQHKWGVEAPILVTKRWQSAWPYRPRQLGGSLRALR